MGRFLLLTGDKAAGKTTAVRRVVEEVGIERCFGFFADEVRRDGKRQGFGLTTLDGHKGVLASTDSESTLRVGGPNSAGVGRYGIELDFLEKVCVPLIRKATSRSGREILVLDEIGPMQLYSEPFKEAITAVLSGSPHALVFGTIVLRSTPWADQFKKLPGVETFLLNEQNRDSLARMMSLYLSETLRTL
ncbi:nucleoside-triphosphatase [Actinomadura decatromicini]|uniref:AAA+ ATPase domain-containing protein n=1 Tax=Actinomadura decatromicini TaxID=2604572 RepID=A0A5D3F9L0_9ACTN|nr:nucleoside-triphosphatase [Actinomadura decatromicini]TYK44594.1 hypothetical protein FXF68_34670 [Actinomadura decatromicini]